MLRQDLSLKVSRLQLGRRIGDDGPVDAQVTDTMLPPDLGYTDEQLIQLALQQAPQYRQARALTRSASYALKGEKGAYLPTFNLTASFTEYDSNFPPSGQGVGAVSLIVIASDLERGPARDRRPAGEGQSRGRAGSERRPGACRCARRDAGGGGVPHLPRGA